MSDDVQYRYEPKVEGAFLLGVPARDLTAADVEALEPRAKEDLAGSEHYAKVEKKMGEQTDPDTNAPGRTDADTLASGVAVPPVDEPIYESAPGFVQADTQPIEPVIVGTEEPEQGK
jgi:hypothetical protein